ncbi:DM13 domain-containing protein [Spirillospora albida]|uniref:DM13 domain-containing protein n=1 Tax=Spirillospora albida TaxID=58123 RepID=UPI0004C20437|nr:DM13 domain-containing protein [Spirillospora albida]
MPRRAVVAALAALMVAAGAGLYLFQPWKAFTDTTVNESLPIASEPAPSPSKGAGPATLAEGAFVSHDHDTSGTARTVRLASGGRILRLEDLRTSEGPDVRVYLSTRSAREVRKGLGDGAVELGRLKGNLGNQNYAVPAGADVSRFRSAVIWCKRFSVSFGAADLSPKG